jgi:hypothetical protein
MKLLLTSAGIKNASIHNALFDLLGKPIAQSSALRPTPTRQASPHHHAPSTPAASTTRSIPARDPSSDPAQRHRARMSEANVNMEPGET